jgi:uncharacterized protein (TIRG00374 family)
MFLIAYRWYVLYHAYSQYPSLGNLLQVTFISAFFNNLFPSTLGGDTYRTLRTDAKDKNYSRNFSVVLVDRLIGLVGLVVLGVVALLFRSETITFPEGVVASILFFGVVIISLVVMAIHPVSHRLISLIGHRLSHRIGSRLDVLFQYLRPFSEQVNLLGYGLILSVLARIAWAGSGYLVGEALHLDLPLSTYLILLPVIEIIRMIPLTPQGIGIRESAFVILFGYAGIQDVDATALSFLFYFLPILNGVIGGFLFALKV